MKNPAFYFAPDTADSTPKVAPKVPRAYGPFNKGIMAALDECEEVALAAQTAPYAAILDTKYAITPAQTAQLVTDIAECERLFGAARTGALSGQTQTDAKAAAQDAIIDAIDEFRTGARLSLKTAAEQSAFGIGIDLEKNESVLAQLAQTILDDPRSPTLRGIGAEEMTALQTALASWKTASTGQRTDQASGQGSRSDAQTLFDSIEERAREIKIAIDGKFSYRKPESTEARKLFHLPIKRPFAPKTSE